jgi:DNA-directed RNA polymerase subunit omega
MVSIDKDKPTVIALREIAEGHVKADILVTKPRVEIDESAMEAEVTALAEAEAALNEGAAEIVIPDSSQENNETDSVVED